MDEFDVDNIQPLLAELVVLLQQELNEIMIDKCDKEAYPTFATGLYFTFYNH